MNARKTLSLVILFLVLLALPVAGRYAHYYAGRPPARPEVARPALDDIEVPTPPAEPYRDEIIRPGDGLVLVDMAHDNQLQMPELSVLAGRLAARGHRLTSWTGGSLEEALLEASAFLVAVPLEFYDEAQVSAVEEFVDHGGRLLLIGDPTRYHLVEDDWGWVSGIDSDAPYLNSLSAPFGITFVDDYLYNVRNNEGSFRNIRLNDWGESDLTAGLVGLLQGGGVPGDGPGLVNAGEEKLAGVLHIQGGEQGFNRGPGPVKEVGHITPADGDKQPLALPLIAQRRHLKDVLACPAGLAAVNHGLHLGGYPHKVQW